MKNLSIDFLRSFVLIAQTGSYTQCAEQLQRTQPAISLQIKKTRRNDWGKAIFPRQKSLGTNWRW